MIDAIHSERPLSCAIYSQKITIYSEILGQPWTEGEFDEGKNTETVVQIDPMR